MKKLTQDMNLFCDQPIEEVVATLYFYDLHKDDNLRTMLLKRERSRDRLLAEEELDFIESTILPRDFISAGYIKYLENRGECGDESIYSRVPKLLNLSLRSGHTNLCLALFRMLEGKDNSVEFDVDFALLNTDDKIRIKTVDLLYEAGKYARLIEIAKNSPFGDTRTHCLNRLDLAYSDKRLPPSLKALLFEIIEDQETGFGMFCAAVVCLAQAKGKNSSLVEALRVTKESWESKPKRTAAILKRFSDIRYIPKDMFEELFAITSPTIRKAVTDLLHRSKSKTAVKYLIRMLADSFQGSEIDRDPTGNIRVEIKQYLLDKSEIVTLKDIRAILAISTNNIEAIGLRTFAIKLLDGKEDGSRLLLSILKKVVLGETRIDASAMLIEQHWENLSDKVVRMLVKTDHFWQYYVNDDKEEEAIKMLLSRPDGIELMLEVAISHDLYWGPQVTVAETLEGMEELTLDHAIILLDSDNGDVIDIAIRIIKRTRPDYNITLKES